MSLISKYSVTIHQKRIKNIYIRIKPDASVHMGVPVGTSKKHIEHVLNQKSKWIVKKLAEINSRVATIPLEYIDGEEIWYLGCSYKIKLIHSEKSYVVLSGSSINIATEYPDDRDRKREILYRWYYTQAEIVFGEIIQRYLSILQKEIKIMRIKEMKSRWGSCNSQKGYINLNLELIKKPIEAIEYVILHELAHLTHPNHSSRFHNYVASYMPDWKERKKMLYL